MLRQIDILPSSAAFLCISQDVNAGVLESEEALIVKGMKKAQRLVCGDTDKSTFFLQAIGPVFLVVVK